MDTGVQTKASFLKDLKKSGFAEKDLDLIDTIPSEIVDKKNLNLRESEEKALIIF